MNNCVKILLITTSIIFNDTFFAAGIKITVERPVATLAACGKMEWWANNCSRKENNTITNLRPGKEYKIDLGLDGFARIKYQFEGDNTDIYTELNIEGLAGWRDLKIKSDGSVYIGPWGLDKERTVRAGHQSWED